MPPKAKTASRPIEEPAEPMTLSPRAAELYERVLDRWELDEVATAILRLAVEAMTRADEAAAIVSREGLCVPDRWGRPQKHPASLLERDHRAAAAASLQKLGLSLNNGD
jgi:hypothetical protein